MPCTGFAACRPTSWHAVLCTMALQAEFQKLGAAVRAVRARVAHLLNEIIHYTCCLHLAAEVEGLKRKLATNLAPEQASLKPSWRVRLQDPRMMALHTRLWRTSSQCGQVASFSGHCESNCSFCSIVCQAEGLCRTSPATVANCRPADLTCEHFHPTGAGGRVRGAVLAAQLRPPHVSVPACARDAA